MQIIKQSDPRALQRRVYFTAVDTTSLLTRLQSSDMSSFVVMLSKNGAGALAAGAVAPTQVDSANAKGLFYVELALADISTTGIHNLIITNTGGTKTMEKREITITVSQAFFATAQTGTLTPTAISTDRTEGLDFWKDNLITAVSGALAGQVKKIGGFTTTGGIFALASLNAFNGSPTNGDLFEILSR